MTDRTEDHRELHELLGAYLLGGLADDDHRAFTEHLRTCAACQQELGQVSGLPRLLSLVDGSAASDTTVPYAAGPVPRDGTPGSAAGSGGDLPQLLAKGRRRRSLRRMWGGLAAAAAVALVFGAGAWFGPGMFESSPPRAHYTATASSGSSAKVAVDLVTRGWGTQLDLSCADMPVGEEILLYVVDASGKAASVASWRGTASGYATVTGATALRPTEIRAVEVRTADGDLLATATT